MKYQKFNNTSLGFTLLEQLIVVFLIGILAAISAPSFLGILQKAKIDDAANTLRIAVQEAQRQAIMKSKNCTIFLPITNTNNPTITSDCFVTGDRTLKQVNLRHNYGSKGNKIVFNFRGQAKAVNDLGIMVIDKQSENVGHQRCLVISNLIGMSRSGNYDSTQKTGASATYCKTIQ